MTCRNIPLPFLPGFTFNKNLGKTRFPRDPIFDTRNNVRIMVDKIRRGAPGAINERYPSIYAKGEVSELPGWVSFNKETLTFDAYFQETLHASIKSPFLIRKCKVYFYLEDGTIKIIEPKVDNSGIPQGTLLSRQRVTLPPPKDDLFYDIVDFNVGKVLEIYGKCFKLVGCDTFTRTFLNRLGIPVPDPIAPPEDPYLSARAKSCVYPKKMKYKTDTFGKFIENDKKVLRFYGYWDERDTGGFFHDLIIYFYLADDTIEVREVFDDKTSSLFMRKGKVPKRYNELPGPGYYDEKVTLNMMANRWNAKAITPTYIFDPLRAGVTEIEYYGPQDLGITAMINLYGKKIVLTDCDEFTKTYYNAKYGLSGFSPAEKPKIKERAVSCVEPGKRKLPPWNGFGSFEDSAQYCLSFEPKPLTRNIKKFFALDREGYDSRILRFKAVLREKHIIDTARVFIMSFYLCDDTIAVNEVKAGFAGPLFMCREKKVLPGQEVYTSEPPDFYEAQHMYIGATIILNRFQFVLIDADEYALRYMEIHCNQFPKANINLIMDKIRTKLKPIYKDFVADVIKQNEQSIIPFEVFRDKIFGIMGDGNFTEHEMITLARNFSAVCKPTRRHSRQFIRQIVITELSRLLWDDLDRFKECLRSYDNNRTGYISKKEAYNLIRSCRLPLDKIIIENMLDVLEKNDKCEISCDDLCKFINHNYCPVSQIAPINTKTELWWPSEPEPIAGKMVDWCAFNKSLDLEYIFNERIKQKAPILEH